MKILVIHGPNLNRLGVREPDVYGQTTFQQLEQLLLEWSQELGITIESRQSNHEGVLIDWIHQSQDFQGLVLNPGGYTHTSVALRDAISSVTLPTIEVHLSNIAAREEFRHHSMVSAVVEGVISGLGVEGYRLALNYLASKYRKDR